MISKETRDGLKFMFLMFLITCSHFYLRDEMNSQDNAIYGMFKKYGDNLNTSMDFINGNQSDIILNKADIEDLKKLSVHLHDRIEKLEGKTDE